MRMKTKSYFALLSRFGFNVLTLAHANTLAANLCAKESWRLYETYLAPDLEVGDFRVLEKCSFPMQNKVVGLCTDRAGRGGRAFSG